MDDNENDEYQEDVSTDSNDSLMETSDQEWDDQVPLTTWDELALKLPFIQWLIENLNLPDNGNLKLQQVKFILERQYGPVWLLNSMFVLIGKLEVEAKAMYDKAMAEDLNESPPPI